MDDAIILALKDCLHHKIMPDFISKHKYEVVELIKLRWTQDGYNKFQEEKAHAKGKIEGKVEGKTEERSLLSRLFASLFKDGRLDDAKKATSDSAYCDKLLRDYNLIPST